MNQNLVAIDNRFPDLPREPALFCYQYGGTLLTLGSDQMTSKHCHDVINHRSNCTWRQTHPSCADNLKSNYVH